MKLASYGASALLAALTIAGSAHGALGPTVPGDVQWDVTATFAGGGTLTGYFYIDVYGQFDGSVPWSLVTTTGGGITGTDYGPAPTTYVQTEPDSIDISPDYLQTLHLQFKDDLSATSPMTVVGTNPIVILDPVLTTQYDSYECLVPYNCAAPSGSVPAGYRVFASGFATSSTPEPAGWTLMFAGLGLGGASLRRRRARSPRTA